MKPFDFSPGPRTRSPRTRLLLERLDDRIVPNSTSLSSTYGTLPLAFQVNEGQAPAQFNYFAQGNDYAIGLSSTGADINLDPAASVTGTSLKLQLVGSNPAATASGQDELITKTNYLSGNNPSDWLTNVASYGQVEYQDVYAGIDMTYSGNQSKLSYDFVVAPGANANAIQLAIRGTEDMSLNANGDLVLQTAAGSVTEARASRLPDGRRHSTHGILLVCGGKQWRHRLHPGRLQPQPAAHH